MNETMWKVLEILIKRHFDGIGYASTWSLSQTLGIELAGCGVPYGDPALEALVKLALFHSIALFHSFLNRFHCALLAFLNH